AVAAVAGYTRYRIDGDPAGDAQISIVDRGGLSVGVPSRVERNPQLVGTKRRGAAERQVLVARGRSDNRTVIMVREVKASVCVGITLLHVQFHDRLPADVMRGVLQGYDRRYDRLVDWVTETEGVFRDDLLGEFSVADLLIAPISDAADQWRSSSAASESTLSTSNGSADLCNVPRRCANGCSPSMSLPTLRRRSIRC